MSGFHLVMILNLLRDSMTCVLYYMCVARAQLLVIRGVQLSSYLGLIFDICSKTVGFTVTFYDLCSSFYHGNLAKSQHCALITKIDSPETASDFKPISRVSMAL
jgi:hypothetical protein